MPSQDHVSLAHQQTELGEKWRGWPTRPGSEGVEGTLEGMQTARLFGTHRVGTISLPKVNPSFYCSDHTLSPR